MTYQGSTTTDSLFYTLLDEIEAGGPQVGQLARQCAQRMGVTPQSVLAAAARELEQ